MSDAAPKPDAPRPAPRIEVECLSCGRQGVLDATPDGSPQASLVEITKRLRCSACGSRAVRASRVRTPSDVARAMRSRMSRPPG